jgi:hypothetical protein
MKLINYYFSFLLFFVHIVSAIEYVYPVASLCNGKTILYIHQRTATSLELFEWNTKTNQTEQILWSVFNPAGLELLPDNSGFSFIDNGRLRIKLFQKRSPKTIDFDEPLYNINRLHWIDQSICYCSAQQNNNFALFQLDNNGIMKCLVSKNNKDYMYPQKIGDQLFYIERSASKDAPGALQYQIVSSQYDNDNACAAATELIADFDTNPIVFLTMISDKEGFVLEHPQNLDSNSSIVLFMYHHIIKQGNSWHKNKIFSFEIPACLLLEGKGRLYESLLPLLPRIVKNKVYFVDCVGSNDLFLEPYMYNLSTNIIQKITVPSKKGHYFVPILCGTQFYCGGSFLAGQKEPLISFLT